MSKLGVHVSAGNRRGFGDFLQKCANTGSPVPVIFSVDQDIWPDIQRFSPNTIVVFRHQSQNAVLGGQDGPGDAYVGDPIRSAQTWMNVIMPVWRLNPAHYYAPINEQDPGTLAGFMWLNTFTLECLRIAEANGFKLAVYAFSAGNPRDGVTDLDRSTLEEKWHELLPSMQQVKQNGHILLLHEYGFNSPEIRDEQGHLIAPDSSLRASAPNLALRYRRSLRYLHQFNADPSVVLSEASAGVGAFSGLSTQDWVADAQWYDSELMKDRAVIGCCLYQLGGAENLRDALPALTAYISKTPTPAPISGDLPVIPEVGGPDVIIPPEEPPQPPEPPVPIEPPLTPPVQATPLDFDVHLIGCRIDPDPTRPKGSIILTFEITATGGIPPYTYTCEGQTLAGPTRDRPASRRGNIIESYTITSSDGQSKQRKFFFASADFPC